MPNAKNRTPPEQQILFSWLLMKFKVPLDREKNLMPIYSVPNISNAMKNYVAQTWWAGQCLEMSLNGAKRISISHNITIFQMLDE